MTRLRLGSFCSGYGLPAGHVTGVPGLSRNQMLTALGNGVVPQQGAAALAELLDRIRR